MNEKKKTSIGGQAIIEGVMMRGPHKTAMAVRKADGEILVETNENGAVTKNKILKLPIIRGCVNFFTSLVVGMKALMFSADQVDFEEEEEESKFDKWLEEKFGDKIKDIVIYAAIAISVVMSVALFIMLPTLLTRGIEWLLGLTPLAAAAKTKAFTSITEGIIKMIIFIGYLAIVSQMKDIKRVFEYHGAEHKTIACYENGEELTVENVRKHERFHPRCGTSFMLIVLVVSILVSSIVTWENVFIRILLKIVLLPVTVGISYEIIKFAGRHDNWLTRIISAPGLWFQRFTTQEPDDSMIEVAIEAVKPVLPENPEDAIY